MFQHGHAGPSVCTAQEAHVQEPPLMRSRPLTSACVCAPYANMETSTAKQAHVISLTSADAHTKELTHKLRVATLPLSQLCNFAFYSLSHTRTPLSSAFNPGAFQHLVSSQQLNEDSVVF